MKGSLAFVTILLLQLLCHQVECSLHSSSFHRRIDEHDAHERGPEIARKRFERSNDLTLTGGMVYAQYFMDVTLGGHLFTVSIDTGSSMMAVDTKGCKFFSDPNATPVACEHKESPYHPNGTNYKLPTCQEVPCPVPFDSNNPTGMSCYNKISCMSILAYADGTVAAGLVASDAVAVRTVVSTNESKADGEKYTWLNASNQLFTMIAMEITSGLSSDASDGIVGLAYANISYGIPTIVDNLVKQNHLTDRFSMCMGDWDGYLVWGVLDEDLYEGNITYVPITSESYYVISTPSLLIGGEVIAVGNRKSIQTIVDSGTTYIITPMSLYDKIAAALRKPCDGQSAPFYCKNSKFFDGTSNDRFICGITREEMLASPNITFDWGNASVTIDGEDYIRHFIYEGKLCAILGIAGINGLDDMMILGDTFMKNFYTIFDRENKRIGFARSKNCGETILDHDPLSSSSSDEKEKRSLYVLTIVAAVGITVVVVVVAGLAFLTCKRKRGPRLRADQLPSVDFADADDDIYEF